MNASVLSGNFHQAVNEAIHPLNENGQRVTRCKTSPLPVLTHVLITDHEGRLAVYSHDLESPVVAYAPARINESFAVCVPAHPLLDWLDIIKKDDSRVDMVFDPAWHHLIIQAGNARATFKCIDALEFPPVTTAQESGDKDPTLASVGRAVSKDDARPELHRVCHRDGLMIGSDGYRLHLAPSEKTEIPEGFPDIAPILESLKTPEYTVIVPAATLARAVKSLKSICKQGDGWVTFHCNGSIEISATSEDAGESHASVEVLNSTGEAEFTLQLSYVLDALAHVSPKVKATKGKRAEQQTVTLYTTSQPDPWTKPGPVWFVNGDLKAAIMQKWERTIPEGTAKPTKSELMSAYNRQRAQLRKEGRPVWALNEAFGNLQRRNWQEVTTPQSAAFDLLAAIAKNRRALENFPGFDPQGIQKVIDFISSPCDPAEVESLRVDIPEYEPNPVAPAYGWCNASQCYVLYHSPERNG